MTSKKDVAKFGDEQKRRRLNGVFGDESGSRIDFVAWDAVAEIINEKLLEGHTYRIVGAKINQCSSYFSTTDKNLQVVLSAQTTVIEENKDKAIICPLNLTPLRDLKECVKNEKVNIAGIICEIQEITQINNQEVLTVKIRDVDTDVDVSFWRKAARSFVCKIGQVLSITNGVIGEYGGYLVVNATYGQKHLDLHHPDLKPLQTVALNLPTTNHLSPKKKQPQKKQVDNLENTGARQEFKGRPNDLEINVYSIELWKINVPK